MITFSAAACCGIQDGSVAAKQPFHGCGVEEVTARPTEELRVRALVPLRGYRWENALHAFPSPTEDVRQARVPFGVFIPAGTSAAGIHLLREIPTGGSTRGERVPFA